MSYGKPKPHRADVTASAALAAILARADHPSAKLIEKLTGRGYTADEAEHAVASAVAAGWVDDNRLMERVIPELIRSGKGPRAIRAALMQKGFARADAEAVDIDAIIEAGEYGGRDADMVSVCASLIIRKCEIENGRIDRKGYAMLMRRGYTPAIISAALEKVMSGADD